MTKRKNEDKPRHAILHKIWVALNTYERIEGYGGLQSTALLADFHKELGRLGAQLRNIEDLYEMPEDKVFEYVAGFIKSARKTAKSRTTGPVAMHRLTRSIFNHLRLESLLQDCKILFPERTRHLYQILVALDIKAESCEDGAYIMSHALSDFYAKLASHCELILDSPNHPYISNELNTELTEDFIAAVTDAAMKGKKDNTLRKNVIGILHHTLDLADLVPKFEERFPETYENGQAITVENIKRSRVA